MSNLIAQNPVDLGGLIQGFGDLGFESCDPLGVDACPEGAPTFFNLVISSAVGIMTVVAGLWFIFVIITGAYGIISSGGDKNAYASARGRITNGFIGLVVVIAAIFVIEIVGFIIGFDLIRNPGQLVETLAPGGP